MKFPGYFLIVSDFIKWAKAQDIPVGPGRGSGAGSLVAYALTITDLDPLALRPAVRALPQSRTRVDAGLRHRLLPGPPRRGDPTTCSSAMAASRWPRSSPSERCRRAACCATSVACCRCPMGRSIKHLTKLVPQNPASPRHARAQAIEGEPKLQADPRRGAGGGAACSTLPRSLEGLQPARLDPCRRHRHRRPAAARSWCRSTATRASDMPVTQFNMKWVEAAGLVKFDFLGLKTLTVRI